MLREYTGAFGVSGCEGQIRNLIKSKVASCGEVNIDRIGNLIVHKKGNGKKVMVSSHMDEVGFIVTNIYEDGRIKFAVVGSIDSRILPSKRVVFGRSGIKGVIGIKPIHLQSKGDRIKPITIQELFIDIGASSREEAEKYVRNGDYLTFESGYIDLGDFIKSKALDDRVGCAIVTELMKGEYNLDLYGAFTVQEEVGRRGAGVAAYSIKPEIAIIVEGTTCADIEKDEKDYITTSGFGPALSIMDAGSFANGQLFKRITEVAERNAIPYQYRRGIMGYNDAAGIHRTGEGCITATISVPTRYIHSPISMINKKDYENTLKLIKLVLKSLEEGEV